VRTDAGDAAKEGVREKNTTNTSYSPQVSSVGGKTQKLTAELDDDDDWQCDDEAESADPSKYHEEKPRSANDLSIRGPQSAVGVVTIANKWL